MGFRSQFEGLVEFYRRWRTEADIYMVYGKEAFPQEASWPAPVPDGQPVLAPQTIDDRLQLVRRFSQQLGALIPFLVDGLSDGMMAAYDAYPFRIFAIAPDGTIGVTSDKGAAGFAPTLRRIEGWLAARSGGAS